MEEGASVEYGFIYLGIFFILALIIWITAGSYNYRKFKKDAKQYQRMYILYTELEMNAGSIPTQVEFFNKREELIKDFPSYHIVYEELEKAEDEDKYFKKHIPYFLALGPIYNI